MARGFSVLFWTGEHLQIAPVGPSGTQGHFCPGFLQPITVEGQWSVRDSP